MTATFEYGRSGRVGIIVPPANTTVEPELAAMMPPDVALYATRLPGKVSKQTSAGLRERFEGYIEALAETADSFGGAPLDAICLGVTGTSYLTGAAAENTLLEKLRKGSAPHAITAARAIFELLTKLQSRRIALVTPYPAWVIDYAKAYWTDLGFDVVGILPLPDVVSIYEVDTEKVVAAGREMQGLNPDAVVLSGTGVATLLAIEQLMQVSKIPVISSNLSVGWWILQALNLDPQTVTPSAALSSISSLTGPRKIGTMR